MERKGKGSEGRREGEREGGACEKCETLRAGRTQTYINHMRRAACMVAPTIVLIVDLTQQHSLSVSVMYYCTQYYNTGLAFSAWLSCDVLHCMKYNPIHIAACRRTK